MASALRVTDIRTAIDRRLFPSVTVWNRLEGRPRTQSFDGALRAEVRDALWMLTKQWQMGEFRGSDAGSPVFTKLQVDTTRLRKYRPGAGAVEAFDEHLPLEAKVERRHVPLRIHDRVASLDLRLAMGREWLALIEGLSAIRVLHIWGITDPGQLDRRVPTVSFTLDGWHPRDVAAALDKHNIYVWDGNYYALAVTERLGLEDKGGMVRVGAAHYNSLEEVSKLVDAVRTLVA